MFKVLALTLVLLARMALAYSSGCRTPAGTAREPDPSYVLSAEKQRLRSTSCEEAECHFLYQQTGLELKVLALTNAFPSTIELEDHSVWEVASQDTDKLYSWYPNDLVVIIPVRSWKYPYDYRLLNQNNLSSIHVSLKTVPLKSNRKCYKLRGIDVKSGVVYLNNGWSLHVSEQDFSILEGWELNDSILIGGNTSHDWQEFSCLLINVRRMDDVRAKLD